MSTAFTIIAALTLANFLVALANPLISVVNNLSGSVSISGTDITGGADITCEELSANVIARSVSSSLVFIISLLILPPIISNFLSRLSAFVLTVTDNPPISDVNALSALVSISGTDITGGADITCEELSANVIARSVSSSLVFITASPVVFIIALVLSPIISNFLSRLSAFVLTASIISAAALALARLLVASDNSLISDVNALSGSVFITGGDITCETVFAAAASVGVLLVIEDAVLIGPAGAAAAAGAGTD